MVAAEVVGAGAAAAVVGVGVPVRLGSALTVISLPWVSISAAGNSASFAFRSSGRRERASWYTESTSGDDEVDNDQSNWANISQRLRTQTDAYRVVRRLVANNFVRHLGDGKLPLDLLSIGCLSFPIQFNLDIKDSN